MLLGTFNLGHEKIKLHLRSGDDGACIFEDSAIYIGKDGDPFDTLLHEVFEFAMFRAGVTYQRADYQTEDANARLFIFTHSQFSNICCQVSRFMVEAGPALNKAQNGK